MTSVLHRWLRWAAGAVAIVLLSMAARPVWANETSQSEGHEYHRHHVGAFLGAATRAAEGGGHDHGFAGGLDYEYRFSRWVGAGALAEGASGDLRDGVFAGLLFAHPWRELVVMAGPGVEVTSEAAEYMTRFGVAYQFPIARRLTLAPEFNVDLVRREPVYVYGLVLGVGF